MLQTEPFVLEQCLKSGYKVCIQVLAFQKAGNRLSVLLHEGTPDV